MSLSTFTLSKSWGNPDDFPTYESDETQVREDMQYLHSEIEDQLNQHVEEDVAENIPFTSTLTIASDNVQDAIEEVMNAIVSTVLPDNSVTTPKMVDSAVTTAKLANGAVTDAKCDFSAGFSPDGAILLTSGVHYYNSSAELPSPATAGRIAFVKL